MADAPSLTPYPGGIPYPPGMTPQKAGAILFKVATKKAKGQVAGPGRGGKRAGAGRPPATLMQTVTRSFGGGGAKK
jgi:hypothetical protein